MTESLHSKSLEFYPKGTDGADKDADLASKEIKKYDFKHPKLVSKENARALQKIHDLLSRNLNRIFTDSLGEKVEVSLQNIDEVIYSEFLSALEPPSALFLFNIEELGDWALMQMDPSFCLYCIERQGGSRQDTARPARPLTRIEERIISRIIDKIFKELSRVWAPYLNITIQNHVYESKPANIRTISSHIPGIIIRYMLRLENFAVPLKICYPYALLKERMKNTAHEPDRSSGKAMLSASEKKSFENYVKKAEVNLNVILGETKIPLKRLLEVEEGDVIKLDQSIEDPLDVLVNGTKKMVGYPGYMDDNKAIKIYKVMNSLKQNEDL